MNTKIIAIVNQKGGVGKTTTALNLGVGLARVGRRVLLLDLDPQSNLTIALGLEPPDLLSISHLIKYTIEKREVQSTDFIISFEPGSETVERYDLHPVSNLFLLPNNSTLDKIDKLMNPETAREMILRRILRPLRGQFDFILIDCLPSRNILMENALTACDSVLVPITPEFLAYRGFDQLAETYNEISQYTNPDLQFEGAVLTFYDGRKNMAKLVRQQLTQDFEGTELRLFDTRISRCQALAEASAAGLSIFDFAPRSKGAIEYAALAEEVLGHAEL